jgi:hypothetical protein
MKVILIQNGKIYGIEPYFNYEVQIGTIIKKEIIPSHGYFFPHPFGRIMKHIANRMKYSFNNN